MYSTRSFATCRCRRGGFSLIELSITVGILAVLFALAVPLAKRLLQQARVAAVDNDLRVFSAAFRTYAVERGDWPPGEGMPGALPPGMAGYLDLTYWQRRSPIGGNYAWDANSLHQGTRYRGVIVIASSPDNPVTGDRTQLLAIDRTLDDGDLATGNFLLGYGNHPVFVLER